MGSNAAQDEFNALFHKTGFESGKAHPEDAALASDHDASDREDEPSTFFNDEEDADDMAVNTTSSTYYVPRATRLANTGPKGVIADAQAFEQAKRQALSSTTSPKKKRLSFLGGQSPPSAYKNEEFDKSSGDEDDEGFMAMWRQRRLMELTSNKFANVLGRSGGKKVYGHLTRVSAEGYLDAIEKAPADTVVVVLIYDHLVRLLTCFTSQLPETKLTNRKAEISVLVEDAVREMARTHSKTRFVKLHYAEAEFEPAGVPAFLAYRGGEKFAGFVPVSDEIPDTEDLSARSLTALLQRYYSPLRSKLSMRSYILIL